MRCEVGSSRELWSLPVGHDAMDCGERGRKDNVQRKKKALPVTDQLADEDSRRSACVVDGGLIAFAEPQ